MSPKDMSPTPWSEDWGGPSPSFLNGAPVLLDVTRALSRAGQGPQTGIDRVERAYIDQALARGQNVWFLARALGGFVLLTPAGMTQLLAHLDGAQPWGVPDFLSRFARRQSTTLRRAEATARRLAHSLIPRLALASTLRRVLPPGFVYLNVGHSNQTASTLGQIRRAGARQVCLMIHDLIPLDLPHTTRPGSPARMARALRAALPLTDVILFNSQATAARVAQFLDECGLRVPGIVAPLGIVLPRLATCPTTAPDLMVLGTIEPRKNHALLLTVWDLLAQTPPRAGVPRLHIVGRRGWQVEEFCTALERHPLYRTHLIEHGALPDDALWPLLARMRGLLFPSLAEGYGLPLAEALAMGQPVLASDLEVFHEVAGTAPTYLDPTNPAAWADAIRTLVDGPHRPPAFTPPRWADHFATLTHGLEQVTPTL